MHTRKTPPPISIRLLWCLFRLCQTEHGTHLHAGNLGRKTNDNRSRTDTVFCRWLSGWSYNLTGCEPSSHTVCFLSVSSFLVCVHFSSAADQDDRPSFNVQAVDSWRNLTAQNAPLSPSRAEWPSKQVSEPSSCWVCNKPHGPTCSCGCSTEGLMGESLMGLGSII